MNEIPKSVRDELARQRQADAHPDADLLTAYSEGTATPDERTQIEQHLAICEDCREVIFLATPEVPAEAPAVVVAKPRTRWFPVWAPWAAAAAVLIVATATLTRRTTETPTESAKVEQRSTPSPVAPSAQANEEKAAPAQESVAKDRPAPRRNQAASVANRGLGKSDLDSTMMYRRDELKKTAPAESKSETSSSHAALHAEVATPMVAPPPPPPPPVYAARSAAGAAAKPGPAAPSQNQMQNQASNQAAQNNATQNVNVNGAAETVEVTSEAVAPVQDAKVTGGIVGRTTAELRQLQPTQWRISASGVVERQDPSSNWTAAFSKPGTKFTVVAVIGSDVWAGGTHGALFRSFDGGSTWRPIFLPGIEDQTVTAIQFRDVWHGSVTTADHRTWTTTDRGTHWQQP